MFRAFDLARKGDGKSAPLGTKKDCHVAERTRRPVKDGSLFGTGTIHEILTREGEAYNGGRRHQYRCGGSIIGADNRGECHGSMISRPEPRRQLSTT